MLRALRLKIVFATLLALFAFILARPLHFDIVLPHSPDTEPFLADEGAVRSERSANISHIIGISRKIQLIVNKIMFLQISPDGSVNGTDNDNDYTILQRASINNFQIKIQGVVTCNFLCMDRCGLLYGSKEFTDDCVFNEMMESHHFNTYSSAKYSNDKRTLYLAVNKKGIPRKVQTKAKASLGKLEAYTNVLTKPVSPDRVEALAMDIAKARFLLGKFLLGSDEDGLSGNHLFRHHRYQFCPNVPMTKLDAKNKFRCRKREKRKKRRKCKEDEDDDDECTTTPIKKKILDKCDEEEEEEECVRRLHNIRQKRKSRNGSESDPVIKCFGGKCADDNEKRRKKRLKTEKKKFGSSEKAVKSKFFSEFNTVKRKEVTKGVRKEKAKFGFQPVQYSTNTSPMWREIEEESQSTDPVEIFTSESSSVSASVESTTEKPLDDYDEEDQTERFADDEEEASAEMGDEWTRAFTPPGTASVSPAVSASASISDFSPTTRD